MWRWSNTPIAGWEITCASRSRATRFNILVGDHQPAASVSGEGASWDVPVHIVSRDPDLLARFTAQGFHAGLEPPREARGGLHDLTTMMLRVFAQP